MKRLILMRHAKSDWSDPGVPDHKRSLNARGILSAAALGDWLRQNELKPEHILCSDAVRTRETLDGLKLAQTPTTFMRRLYLAESDVMKHIVMQQTADCIMMIAHNPGTAFVADNLVASRPDDSAFDRFPTCATAVIEFDIDEWNELKNGTGIVTHFVVPRALID